MIVRILVIIWAIGRASTCVVDEVACFHTRVRMQQPTYRVIRVGAIFDVSCAALIVRKLDGARARDCGDISSAFSWVLHSRTNEEGRYWTPQNYSGLQCGLGNLDVRLPREAIARSTVNSSRRPPNFVTMRSISRPRLLTK